MRLGFFQNRFWHTERQKFWFLFLTSNNPKYSTSLQHIGPRTEIYVILYIGSGGQANSNKTYALIRKSCKLLVEIFFFETLLFVPDWVREWLLTFLGQDSGYTHPAKKQGHVWSNIIKTVSQILSFWLGDIVDYILQSRNKNLASDLQNHALSWSRSFSSRI